MSLRVNLSQAFEVPPTREDRRIWEKGINPNLPIRKSKMMRTQFAKGFSSSSRGRGTHNFSTIPSSSSSISSIIKRRWENQNVPILCVAFLGGYIAHFYISRGLCNSAFPIQNKSSSCDQTIFINFCFSCCRLSEEERALVQSR